MARKASRTPFALDNGSHDEPTLKAAKRGFTIVELLIVIVVIAILAAITVVAYNGIQNRARASGAQAAAEESLPHFCGRLSCFDHHWPQRVQWFD